MLQEWSPYAQVEVYTDSWSQLKVVSLSQKGWIKKYITSKNSQFYFYLTHLWSTFSGLLFDSFLPKRIRAELWPEGPARNDLLLHWNPIYEPQLFHCYLEQSAANRWKSVKLLPNWSKRIKMPWDNLEDCIICDIAGTAVGSVIKMIWHKKPFTFLDSSSTSDLSLCSCHRKLREFTISQTFL